MERWSSIWSNRIFIRSLSRNWSRRLLKLVKGSASDEITSPILKTTSQEAEDSTGEEHLFRFCWSNGSGKTTTLSSGGAMPFTRGEGILRLITTASAVEQMRLFDIGLPLELS